MCLQFQSWLKSVDGIHEGTSDHNFVSVSANTNELDLTTGQDYIKTLPLNFCPVCGESIKATKSSTK